ncbi:MAG: DNA polymerase III subunit beta [Candidatus Kerfeldbacteria bacterium]|nr:DNA polymerase III subunit beta [Candidatus Kerfeldbacteria bacterium]
MKFLCTQDNLLVGLGAVVHIASRNTALPILNNILLKTTKAGLELAATNLEVGITTTVRGKTEKEGAITIQGKLLLDWVNLTPVEKIELEVLDGNLLITAGKRHATIRGIPSDEFPVIPEISSGIKFVSRSDELISALTCISLSVKTDEGRPEISGVLWQIKNNQLFLVGTDSYRLTEARVTIEGGQDIQIITPLKTVQELIRVASGSQDVQVLVNDNQILFTIDDTKIISRLVSGQYPDYQQIVPSQFINKLIIEKDELVQAVRAASLFVRAGINDIKLNYSPGGVVIISSANTQIGENFTEIVPVKSEGEGVEIVFNYRYFLDGLQSIVTSRVVLELNNSNSPAMIKPLERADFYYIIMPIRQ